MGMGAKGWREGFPGCKVLVINKIYIYYNKLKRADPWRSDAINGVAS